MEEKNVIALSEKKDIFGGLIILASGIGTLFLLFIPNRTTFVTIFFITIAIIFIITGGISFLFNFKRPQELIIQENDNELQIYCWLQFKYQTILIKEIQDLKYKPFYNNFNKNVQYGSVTIITNTKKYLITHISNFEETQSILNNLIKNS